MNFNMNKIMVTFTSVRKISDVQVFLQYPIFDKYCTPHDRRTYAPGSMHSLFFHFIENDNQYMKRFTSDIKDLLPLELRGV